MLSQLQCMRRRNRSQTCTHVYCLGNQCKRKGGIGSWDERQHIWGCTGARINFSRTCSREVYAKWCESKGLNKCKGRSKAQFHLPLPPAAHHLFHCASTRSLWLLLFWSSTVGSAGENLLDFLPLSSKQNSTGTSSSMLASTLQTRAGWRVWTWLFCHDSHPLF